MIAALFLLFSAPIHAAAVSVDKVFITTAAALTPTADINFTSPVSVIIGSSLTLQGVDGYITTASSVNASSIFGDGQNLSGVTLISATQTFSGANTFLSSFTVRSSGSRIILSTSASTNNLGISSAGVTTFYPALHTASYVAGIPGFNTTKPLLGDCIPGSTITITTTGGAIEAIFSGQVYSSSSTMAILQDGEFPNNLSTLKGIISSSTPNGRSFFPASFSYLLDAPTPGTHSYCLSLASPNGGTSSLSDGFHFGLATNIFYVVEIK